MKMQWKVRKKKGEKLQIIFSSQNYPMTILIPVKVTASLKIHKL